MDQHYHCTTGMWLWGPERRQTGQSRKPNLRKLRWSLSLNRCAQGEYLDLKV